MDNNNLDVGWLDIFSMIAVIYKYGHATVICSLPGSYKWRKITCAQMEIYSLIHAVKFKLTTGADIKWTELQ